MNPDEHFFCYRWQEHDDTPCDFCGKTRKILSRQEMMDLLKKVLRRNDND